MGGVLGGDSLVHIDPASITEENVAVVLGALVVEIQNMNSKIDEQGECLGNRLTVIENTLREHESLFWGPFRFSRCDLVPFIWKHKWLLLLIWTSLSIGVSAIEFIVRGI
jgi:hypothetical protein